MKREKPLLRLLSSIVARAHAISFALILAAIAGLLALPLLDRPIKFDEKGLLAGSAHPTIGHAGPSLLPAAARIAAAAATPTAFRHPGAAAALADELRLAGLTATQLTHATVLADPSTAPGAPPALCPCTNVHTRIRSSRGDGTESLALVTPVAFGPPPGRSQDHAGSRPGPNDGGPGPIAASQPSGGSSGDGTHPQTAEAAELALLTGASLALHLALGPPPPSSGSWGGSGSGPGAVGSAGRWLARDLLWVVPDLTCGPHQCLDAWVRQYHHGHRGQEAAGRSGGLAANASTVEAAGGGGNAATEQEQEEAVVMVRGGVIQQAVVLEALAGPEGFDAPEVLVVGHEGLLPKLDMFYLLRYLFNYPVSTRLWRQHEVEAAQRAVTSWLQRLLPGGLAGTQATQDYLRRLLTGLHFAWHQAVGLPSGPHAAFKDSMVDAATVRLVPARGPGRSRPSPGPFSARLDRPSLALALAASLELTLRSLNNLVERVHHSSFLYVLTGLDSYVSVERYVGPAVALAAVLQLQAAWSMLQATRALGASAGAPGAAAPIRIWAVAAARACTRTAALAAAAAALRDLACQPLPAPGSGGPSSGCAGEEGVCSPGNAAFPGLTTAAAAALLQGALASPLVSASGVLVAAGLLLVVAGGAAAAARVAGRMVSAAVKDKSGGGVAEAGAGREGAGKKAPQQEDAAGGGGGARGRHGFGVDAAWHAERTLVLTITAAAMAALVCMNWAAAVVAGCYIASLALGQGLVAVRADPRKVVSTGGLGERSRWMQGPGIVRSAAWLAAAPAVLPWVVRAIVSEALAGGEISMGTVGSGVCGLSLTNYWYAYVVSLSFWLFGFV